MKGTVHKFKGDWEKTYKWEGTRSRLYKNDPDNQVSETWMIGKKEGAENFAFRYYHLEQGGHSNKEQHPYDHGIMILQGSGNVLMGEETHAAPNNKFRTRIIGFFMCHPRPTPQKR